MTTNHHVLCFVLGNYWGQCIGGAELQASFLADETYRQGWKNVCCFFSNGNDYDSNPRIILHPIQLRKIWQKFGNIKYPYANVLLAELRRIKPSVIYQRGGSSLTGICAWYAAKYGCRFIFHIASDVDLRPANRNWYRPYLIPETEFMQYGIKHANLIFAQTQRQADDCQSVYGKTAKVVLNGHPIPKFSAKKNGLVNVLWIANWKDIKQPEIFVRLVQTFTKSFNVNFAMIGRVDRYNDLANEAIAAGIYVMGELPNEKVNKLLEQSHLLVNTSRYEGFSNTFIQAWLRCLPVLSLNVDPDGVINRYGLGFCSGNFDRLTEDFRLLIKDQALREKMGIDAREYAIKNHSLANFKILANAICS